MSLSLPKVVSEGAKFFRYIQDGAVNEVQDMLQRGLAAPDMYVARDNRTESALFFAFMNGQYRICKLLISWGADPTTPETSPNTLLPINSTSEYAWLISWILPAHFNFSGVLDPVRPTVDLEAQDLKKLHRLIIGIEPGCVETAIGANLSDVNAVDIRGWSALHWAAWKGKDSVMRHLLHAGADMERPDNFQNRPLHLCVLAGSNACLTALLGAGCDRNPRNMLGIAPPHFATYWGYVSASRLLLDAGADPNLQSDEKRTPLMKVVSQGHNAVLEMLLTHGPELEHRDRDDNTVVMYALLHNNHGAVDRLLAAGARLDVVDAMGRTSLHFAGGCGDVKMPQLLKSSNLDNVAPSALDISGLTALQILKARSNCTSELLKAFEELLEVVSSRRLLSWQKDERVSNAKDSFRRSSYENVGLQESSDGSSSRAIVDNSNSSHGEDETNGEIFYDAPE